MNSTGGSNSVSSTSKKLRVFFAGNLQAVAVQGFQGKISELKPPDTSEQSSLCSDVLLFLRNKMPTPLLLLSKPNPLPLGFGLGPLCGRLFFISDRHIDFDRSLQKENHSPSEWFSFWYFGGLWPPPILGISMLGRAESSCAKVLDVKSKIVSMC